MKLVDTSVWIAFWRGEPTASGLSSAIDEGSVALHPWVLGELALGDLGRGRTRVLGDLRRLPTVPVAQSEIVLDLIERHALAATGLGWVDAQLLAAARAGGLELWSLDRRLAAAWTRID